MEVVSKFWRGNSKGVGFAVIPKELEKDFKENENVKVTGRDIPLFFARMKIHKNRIGVYVPKEMCSGLIGKGVKLFFEKTKGFHSTIGSDGRLYIPLHIAEKFRLNHNDIILVEGNLNDLKKEKICLLKKHKQRGTGDCMVIFDRQLSGLSGIFNVREKLSRKLVCPKFIKNAISGFNYAQIGKNEIILYFGKMMPVIINTDLKISDIAYYLGMYFSDGTKKGFNWAITASTFEQGRYCIRMHKKLIKSSKIDMCVTFTNQKVSKKIKIELSKRWDDRVGINLDCRKVRIVKTGSKSAPNRNENGALTIREGRQLLILYYKKLIETLLDEIKRGNTSLGIDFLCGILEGDGCANAKSRGHISIATNNSEKNTIEILLNSLEMEYNIYQEGENKYNVRIGALELIRNLPFLKDKLFKYYPKRRAKFIKRFHNVGGVRFILGEQKHASAWVKAYLRDNGILDYDYKLTIYGGKIRKCLEDMIQEKNPKYLK